MIEPDIAALACANATAGQLAQLKVLCDEVEMLYTEGCGISQLYCQDKRKYGC